MSLSGAAVLDRRGGAVPLDEVARAFGLQADAARPVPGGKNEHFVVDVPGGQVFLRRSHRGKLPAELRAQVRWTEALRTAGLPTLVHLPAEDGTPVHVHEDRLWTASAALPGSTPPATDPDLPALLGASAATYHRLAEGLPPPDGLPVAAPLGPQLRERLAACPPAALPPDVSDLVARVADVLDRLPGLPRAVVHGGARRGSLRVQDGRVVGVLDLDSARHDARVLDLATAVHDVGKGTGPRAERVGLDLDRVRALSTAYGAVHPLLPAELELLPPVLLARRLHRLLGRAQRVATGLPVTDNDRAKVLQEQQHLAWLGAHEAGLAAALRPALG